MKTSLLVVLVVALVLAAVFFARAKQASSPAVAPTTVPVIKSTVAQERALYIAVDKNDLDTARKLLAANPRLVGARSAQRGETPLHHALSPEMAQLLLDSGADPAARDRQFNARPVRWAANNWATAVVKLLEQKAGPDDDIAYYCATGNAEKLSQLLKNDPAAATTPTTKDVLGSQQSLLHLAAKYGQTQSCELLLSSGANIAAEGGFFDAQPLEAAAWAGYTDTVKTLIQRGADVNAEVHTDKGPHTAIWWAALTGRKEIVQALLDAGATVEDGLADAVRQSIQRPYPGRALPPRQDYEAVVDLLEKHGVDQ